MITANEDDEDTGRWRCAEKSSGADPAVLIAERLLLPGDMILDVIGKHDPLRHGRSAKQMEAPKQAVLTRIAPSRCRPALLHRPVAPSPVDMPSLIDMGSVEENQGRSRVA